MDQERELMVRQQRLLQEELDARTKEVMTIRREKTSVVLELRADVDEKIEEVNFKIYQMLVPFLGTSFHNFLYLCCFCGTSATNRTENAGRDDLHYRTAGKAHKGIK